MLNSITWPLTASLTQKTPPECGLAVSDRERKVISEFGYSVQPAGWQILQPYQHAER